MDFLVGAADDRTQRKRLDVCSKNCLSYAMRTGSQWI